MIDLDVLKKLSQNTKYANDILERLEGFGIVVTMGDELVLRVLANKSEEYIKNRCNVSVIPDGLKCVYVDMVCSDYINEKYKLNQLDGFSLDEAVKEVTMGDVSVSYGGLSADDKFRSFIESLRPREGDLVCYRRIHW